MSRVIIPINVKLNAFILLLLSASIVFYVYYAVNLFESDKMAYVFESIKSQNRALANNLSSKVDQGQLVVDSLSKIRYSTKALQEMFNSTEELRAFLEIKDRKVVKSIHDQSFTTTNFNTLIAAVDELPLENKVFHLKLNGQDVAVLIQREAADWFIGIFDYQFFTQSLDKSRLYHYGIMDTHSASWIAGENLFKENLFNLVHQQINKMGVDAGTFILPIENENWIIAFDSLPKSSKIFLTLVEEKKALEASQMLKHKSIFFGTFVLSIAILLGFLFSKIFTIPIKRLYEGSRNFVAQNFESRVKVNSWDELGVLADSFNTMADDIEKYMEEMEQKTRLENELKTAQLVQSSFFEGESLEKGYYKMFSFYRPASECGGDWWGSIEKDGKLIIIVVDATGHGTAAALITAVIHNCQTALKYLMQLDSHYLTSSSYIMDYLNQSVCNVKSNLMATAFVAVIDRDREALTYTNASHNPPMLLKGPMHTMDKSDIIPLMEGLGKRLGEDVTSKYEQIEIALGKDQRLLFYTDGLVEGENEQGKQWGKRKLIKIILDHQSGPTQTIVNNIVADAYTYFGTVPQSDDICVVGVEMT